MGLDRRSIAYGLSLVIVLVAVALILWVRPAHADTTCTTTPTAGSYECVTTTVTAVDVSTDVDDSLSGSLSTADDSLANVGPVAIAGAAALATILLGWRWVSNRLRAV